MTGKIQKNVTTQLKKLIETVENNSNVLKLSVV